MRRAALWTALAAAALLQGCGREPVQTRVDPPRHSLPDDAPLRPAPSAAAPVPPAEPSVRDPGDPQGAQLLAQRPLLVPVVGIAPGKLSDNYEQSRGARKHEALDILAPHGTPVVAADDGRIAKLFTSKPGGLTIYQYDPSGQLAYYYAHLQRYAEGLREGQEVKRGDVIGYVGVTGNSDPNAPHLHFGVFRLGTPPKWWQGEAVNPYPALSRATPSSPQVATR
jgi:murein DD-endopeptidase MepM/ murein hydrolase activator NlpD